VESLRYLQGGREGEGREEKGSGSTPSSKTEDYKSTMVGTMDVRSFRVFFSNLPRKGIQIFRRMAKDQRKNC